MIERDTGVVRIVEGVCQRQIERINLSPEGSFSRIAWVTDEFVRRLKLLYDVVVIAPDPVVEQQGGIIIPPSARLRQWQGIVLATGPGSRPGYERKRVLRGSGPSAETWLLDSKWTGNIVPLDVHVGDHVLLTTENVVELKKGEAVYWFTRQPEIMAVLGTVEGDSDER